MHECTSLWTVRISCQSSRLWWSHHELCLTVASLYSLQIFTQVFTCFSFLIWSQKQTQSQRTVWVHHQCCCLWDVFQIHHVNSRIESFTSHETKISLNIVCNCQIKNILLHLSLKFCFHYQHAIMMIIQQRKKYRVTNLPLYSMWISFRCYLCVLY